ncbi:beta-ketoacyl reductase [Streptomyces sp. SCSIO ZS0520]|uniref:beta-ketoacyl reductase n=1 Tax=Streptomyces sp. SCSIO ZS0520 TaxID=2892996 RepID=UPI0021DA1203|nr:beta-ketoacyl reductase [Streptomyces sp. SCSIO ZS0520]
MTLTACDTTNPHQLHNLLTNIPTHHPLTAVIHTAGTLDDATLTTLTPQQLHPVLANKIDTAHHLHTLTRHHNLAAFVMYSSAAGVLGSAGQANYSAANAYLDALAAHRQAQGLPGTSLAWGLWAEAGGMTAHLGEQDRARMARSAIAPMSNAQALALFDASDRLPHPMQLASLLQLNALPADPLWSRLATVRPEAVARQQGPALSEELARLGETERQQHVLELVRRHMAVILMLDSPGSIESGRGFLDQGLDSLTAVELRNRLAGVTGIRLPATVIFDHPSPAALARYIVGKTESGTSGETAQGVPEGADRVLSELDRIEAMLTMIPKEYIAESRIPARLHALLAGMNGGGAADDATVEERLGSASTEDLFQFIDSEL